MADTDLLNSFLAKIHKIITSPVTGQESTSHDFISFTKIGIPVSDDFLNFGSLQTIEEQDNHAQFSLHCDILPHTDGFYLPSGSKMTSIYRKIVYEATTAKRNLTAEQETKLKKYLQMFKVTDIKEGVDEDGDPIIVAAKASEKVRLYDHYRTKYNEKVKKYHLVLENAKSPDATREQIRAFQIEGPTLEDDARRAFLKWESQGFKGTVEKAQAYISQYSSGLAFDLFTDARKKMNPENQLDTKLSTKLGRYYPTYLYPNNFLKLMSKEGTFTKISFNEKTIDEYKNYDKKTFSGGGGGSFRFIRVGGKVNGVYEEKEVKIDTKNMSLEIEIAQFMILRPWFDGTILNSRGWKLNEVVSDGGEPRKGLMGVYPTSILFGKGLKLTLNMNSQTNIDAIKDIKTSSSAYMGPFKLKGGSGGGDIHSEDSEKHVKENINGVESIGVQIIGFICNKVDKCPNPDPDLNWVDNPEN